MSLPDPAILAALAFSDYHLWSSPSLRDPNRDGFIPLRTLVHTSPVFLAAADVVSLTEAAVVKSLRTHARDIYDIRMIVVDNSRPRRARHGHALAGGYEVRRKDWAEVTQRFPTFNPEYWDSLTIYIENVPLPFRSIVGISKLLSKLLPQDHSPSSSLGNYRFIQSIFFPPHHQDRPDAVPKCKGFALVTLSEPSATSHLLTRFPFHKRNTSNDDSNASSEELEARKAGFRTLSKERWEALQSDYAEYRDALLRLIAESSSSAAPSSTKTPASSSTAPADKAASTNQLPCEEVSTRAAESPQRYPPGCVIFARHVPQDTNKTALRARFSALLADADDDTTALDYVDYSKGLDSCYLRLTTGEHALSLLKRFQGSATGEGIVLELLDGRREEMYWESLPDKVRALALQRTQARKPQRGQGDVVRVDDNGTFMENGERKPRRRRR
ncbi:hypothetical protein BC827DRAFT_1214899 [Russula dissimulans]|nr:hypothetical protein BC827DRAFT_1214899 [Russula dissimulans]